MELILGIIAVVAIALGVYVAAVRKVISPSRETKQLPSASRTVFNLEIGDVVQHLGVDWLVEGKLKYQVGAYYWIEYLLQDKEEIAWLSVEEEDTVEVALLKPTKLLDVPATPPQQLNFGGDIYRLESSGTAKMSRTGVTMERKAEKCDYYDYESDSNQVLSIEFWGRDVEVCIGQKISPRALTILPGDGKSVYRDFT